MLRIKELIKEILEVRFEIDISFSNIDYDCTKIYLNGKNGLNNVCDLLNSLDIQVISVNEYNDCFVITTSIIEKNTIWSY